MRVRIGLCTRSYVATFDEEEVDPDTLIMVLQQQGRAALDEALQQLGVKPLGHRVKIANALQAQ